jgi:hypothetical protein
MEAAWEKNNLKLKISVTNYNISLVYVILVSHIPRSSISQPNMFRYTIRENFIMKQEREILRQYEAGFNHRYTQLLH